MTLVGLPGVDASHRHWLVASARIPEASLTTPRRAAIAALQEAEVRVMLTAHGANPGGNSAEEFGACLRSENKKWGEVIRPRQHHNGVARLNADRRGDPAHRAAHRPSG